MASPFVAVADLAAFIGEPIADTDAQAIRAIASGTAAVQSFLGSQVAAGTTVELCDPINAAYLVLSELPVVNVTTVEYFDAYDTLAFVTADPTQYTVSRRLGIIAALPFTGISWPGTPESWRVTYDYGYAVIPDAILTATLGYAARQYATPPGIQQEKVGSYLVRYDASNTAAFTPSELAGLRPYVQVPIA